MTTSNPTNFCFTCEKVIGRVKCGGCSKLFCFNDFEGHQRELGKQLEKVQDIRDLFQQSLKEKITDPRKHSLVEQINAWENQSINRIRQAAEELRQVIIKHTTQLNTELEEKLNKLTDQLRRSREAKDFFETELNQWREELTQMNNELTKPTNLTIRQNRIPLIAKITIDISDVKSNIQPNKEIRVPVRDDSVFCSLCNEQLPSPAAMREHLMMCGNKTDECPNCHKFIRRAILAYHRTNSCANPDDETTDHTTDQQMPSSRNAQRPLARPSLNTGYRLKRAESFDGRYGPPRSQNVVNMLQQPLQKTFYRYEEAFNQSNNDANIPCESCNSAVPFHQYENHIRTCRNTDDQEKLRRPRLPM